MAYLMASGKWRCEGWTYCDRGTEKNGRDWIASKPLDFLSIAILVGSCCFPPNVFVPGKLCV